MANDHFACQDGMCVEPVGPNRVRNRDAQTDGTYVRQGW